MIDGLTKHVQDRFWDRVGRHLAKTGITADQVTWIGAALLCANAGAYAALKRPVLFVVGIVLFELLDDLDGAVARVTGTTSRHGAYLDAMTDRYKDVAVIAALAYVHNAWVTAFFGMFGATVTSYAKARAGMEMPVSNAKWPDLFERFERIAFVCMMLVVAELVRVELRDRVVVWGLAIFAVLTNVTALQRFVRARTLLRAHDAS